ncbi:COMM domain-containing protein 1 isoform X2 [Narcine bancroftii]|uniref:COMM domain-containing protein 1 isoform X2 n=1 Tax=Narcine bancroftii TaxID=1343680 RepID=UPI003831442B
MADVGSKALSGLLAGLAQISYFHNPAVTEQMLKTELYPELSEEDFRVLVEKMNGILRSITSADMDFNQLEAFLTAQTRKQKGITSEQAAVLTKFWKSHKVKIRECLINQSKWENCLRNFSWRVDLKTQSRHLDQINTPVALVELELGKNDQESEFLRLELNENKVNQLLKKITEIEESITALSCIN